MRHRLCALLLLALLLSPGVARAEGRALVDPTQPSRRVVVVPLGKGDDALARITAEAIEKAFDLEVAITAPVPLPKTAWYEPRKRWRAEKLLTYLAALDVGPAWKVLGMTTRPISTTKGDRYDWGIAGLASLDGRAGVLTSFLFRRFRAKAPERFRRYVENLVLHELGHNLGLDHCPRESCIMADAKGNAIRAARLSTNRYCDACAKALAPWLRLEGFAAPLQSRGQ
ncbi:MAG: hypothetical protein P1V51_01270 [Deltaproteobacteria bacterium]|nr:hypothetical protein [Deltaproteobacteria bacterium]